MQCFASITYYFVVLNICILEQVPSMDTDDEQVLSLLVESFLLSGRVTNVTSLIALHPQYLECFLKTEFSMFKGEGPLPFIWRCYIAIMVSAVVVFHSATLPSFSFP